MTDEERVRQLAYSIWEAEGRPEGQQQQHWDRALKIAATEQVAGNEAELEEVGEPLDETPILEDDLPLEDDERGIQENRLPLDDPEGEPDFDELPYRDDRDVAQDVPVQDRGSPGETADEHVPTAASTQPLPAESAAGSDPIEEQDKQMAMEEPGEPGYPPETIEPPAGPMEPMPEDSATATRARRPRRDEDTLTAPNATDTTQVPGKKAGRGQSQRKATTAKADAKPAKKTTPKAKKTTKPKP
ncbi:DUF2934 domain-containing protein [Halomonas sp. Bachu 37]|uniref:DUF2934 domain-containing protein n=1 Tax=Halomonas kashgarensis TaxID=3084920 RepID=UPI003216CDC2